MCSDIVSNTCPDILIIKPLEYSPFEIIDLNVSNNRIIHGSFEHSKINFISRHAHVLFSIY